MAFIHGKSTKVFIGATEQTSYFKDSTVSQEVDMAETSTYGNTYKTFLQGLAAASINLSGLYDSTEDIGPDAVLSSILGSTSAVPVTVAPQGTAIGSRLYSMAATENNVEISSTIGDVVSINASFQTFTDTGKKLGGVSLHDIATDETASTDSATFDNGAASEDGGFVVLHLTENTYDGGTDIIVEHSVDDSVWATLATFTTVATETTASEIIEIAPGTTVRRYVRVSSTLGGTTGAVNFTATLVRS